MSESKNRVPAEFCHRQIQFWSCGGSTHDVLTPEQKQ